MSSEGGESATLAPGTVFGAYELVRVLGAGAFGAVYEARQTRPLVRRVALKVLHRGMVDNAQAHARFFREAQELAQLSHPHVVVVYDVGEHDGRPYFAMEYLEGESLSERLRREGALSVEATLDVMLPVLSAVAAAHDAGIVHRDLKPSNILLARSRSGTITPKLLDFGIVKVQGARSQGIETRTQMTLGTPNYMSPEQVRESRSIDGRSDQFALGAILWECVAGRRLFEGEATYEILNAVMTQPVPPVRKWCPRASEGFESAVFQALERDPERRYQSVRVLGRVLLASASARARALWSDEFGEDVSLEVEPLTLQVPARPLSDPVPGALAPVRGSVPSGPLEVPPKVPEISLTIPGSLAASEVPVVAVRAARPARRGWWAGGVLAVALAGLGVAAVALLGSSDERTEAVVTYRVLVRVTPGTATLELDGRQVGRGVLAWDLPRDGRAHTVRAVAAGYEAREVRFTDSPPPGELRLTPVRPTVVVPPTSPERARPRPVETPPSVQVTAVGRAQETDAGPRPSAVVAGRRAPVGSSRPGPSVRPRERGVRVEAPVRPMVLEPSPVVPRSVPRVPDPPSVGTRGVGNF